VFHSISCHVAVVEVSLAVFDGTLLAVGGSDGISTLTSVEAYNPDSNTWRCELYFCYDNL